MFDSNRLQPLQQTPLWDFACAFYAQKDVATACLTLQDHAGVDVCELLFHAWLCRFDLKAQPKALAGEREARERWQQGVTQTLRALRRSLKVEAAHSASIHQLRETIKRAELEAERENLRAWQAFALKTPHSVLAFNEPPASLQTKALWLHCALFSLTFEQGRQALSRQSASVESAWQVVAGRLDLLISAR